MSFYKKFAGIIQDVQKNGILEGGWRETWRSEYGGRIRV